MDTKTIKEYIRALEHMTAFFRTMLDDELRMPSTYIPENSIFQEANELRFLLKSDAWPMAVPPDLICADEYDSKMTRASGLIYEFVKTDITDKKFLDFGCGEGHATFAANNLVEADAVGYDIESQKWDIFPKSDRLAFTTDFEKVKEMGPYDVIMANDVIDHCDDPLKALKQIESVLKPDGKVYIRFHPWTSRHATHLYRTLNKAYAHLVFSDEELQVIGVANTKVQKFFDPINDYQDIIKKSNLEIINEDIIRHEIELIFTTKDSILRRIKSNFENNNKRFSRDALEIQFINYVLKKGS